MHRRTISRSRGPTFQALSIGVSALALMGGAQTALAQTSSEPTQQPRSNEAPPAGQGDDQSNETFSGATGVRDATDPPIPGTAGGTSGTAGNTPESQDAAPDTARDEIVVTGIRQSLANAQSIKRNADTVVDAITAEDIGALPDRSVNEALQRVPGVAISRFAAPNDSQHYSVQGSGVLIRGLSYVRGEFNGRDTFAVGGGREIGFNDVPTELVGSIEVFKNLTADLIEGGISGSVNINTRKPFDSNKDLLFLSVGMGLGDLEQRGAPQGVAVASKTFDLSSGARIGALASVTYSNIKSRADSVFTASFLPRFNDDRNGNGVQDAGEGRTINAGTPFQSILFDTFPVPTGFDRVYAPLGAGSRTQSFDRERFGISGALQFESADRSFLVTAQFLRTESVEDWIERTLEPNVYYGDVTTVFPAAGSTFTYDDDGIFTSGILARRTGAVQGNRPNGGGFGVLPQFAPDGIFTTQSNRHFYSKSTTQDQALNVKWSPTDRLHFNLDGQYVTSKLKGIDDILDTATFSQTSIDLRGDFPQIETITPGFNSSTYFSDPNSLFFRNAFNNRAINDGEEYALRADVEYEFDDTSFLRAARAGVRYADRDQTVRSNDYNNWGFLSEVWAGNGPISYAQIPAEQSQVFGFDNFFRGSANQPPATRFVNPEIVQNHEAFTELLRTVARLGGGSYTPIEDRTNPNGGDLIKGYFLPNEVYKNTEQTKAAYVRLDFGSDTLFGSDLKLSGNVGLRYVNTKNTSLGSITFPLQSTVLPPDSATPPRYTDLAGFCALPRQPGSQIPSICTLTPGQQQAVLAFANGATTPNNGQQKFDHWLPSLNMKLDLTPKLLMRFAASRAISRPNFGDLRNYVGLNPSGGNTTGVFGFQASARNPFLRPVEADQFDLTAEWYFAKVGSLTGALFYKNLSNIIVENAGFNREFTNNGQTFGVPINGPANVEGEADIKGFELSYQQTYDFLPGALRGLGVQATYTFIDAGNIPNPVPANAPADGSRPPLDVTGLYDNLPLQGLSKHNFNLSAFYDLGGIYTRLAYSWRSKFLLTNRDCCFPFLPVYSLNYGQLDGSAFLTVNENFKIGIEVQNILDSVNRTTFVLNGDGLEAPRSFFKSDRQFTLTTRLTF